MKVLISITSDLSITSFYIDYLKYLSGKGLDVVVATNFESDLSRETVLKTGAKLRHIPFTRDPSPFQDFVSFCLIYRAIRQEKPDVIVYATPKASLLTAMSAFLLRVPRRIYQLWGLRFETSDGILKFLLLQFEKLVFQLSTQVISVSPSLSTRASDYRLGKKPVILGAGSSHGVDLTRFYPDQSMFQVPDEYVNLQSQSSNAYFVTLIARLSRDKGVDVFIEAIKQLRLELSPAIGVLVGNIEDQSIRGLIGQAVTEGFVIHVPHTADVRPYLIHSKVNCLPSLREGLPNVVLEASAMGIPSVVTDATGCVDAVIDGETGFIVKVSDVQGLSQAIKTIGEDQILRDRMSVNCIRFIESRFVDEKVYRLNYQNLVHG